MGLSNGELKVVNLNKMECKESELTKEGRTHFKQLEKNVIQGVCAFV